MKGARAGPLRHHQSITQQAPRLTGPFVACTAPVRADFAPGVRFTRSSEPLRSGGCSCRRSAYLSANLTPSSDAGKPRPYPTHHLFPQGEAMFCELRKCEISLCRVGYRKLQGLPARSHHDLLGGGEPHASSPIAYGALLPVSEQGYTVAALEENCETHMGATLESS